MKSKAHKIDKGTFLTVQRRLNEVICRYINHDHTRKSLKIDYLTSPYEKEQYLYRLLAHQ